MPFSDYHLWFQVMIISCTGKPCCPAVRLLSDFQKSETSCFPYELNEIQMNWWQIAILYLERCAAMVDSLGVFSSNETAEEISTSGRRMETPRPQAWLRTVASIAELPARRVIGRWEAICQRSAGFRYCRSCSPLLAALDC